MDQPSALNFEMDSSAVPTPSQGMSSPKPSTPDAIADTAAMTDEAMAAASRQHPIPPASEPMQYRAIGLIEGVYTPSDDQFTRGNLKTDDDTAIDAVLLGRVLSLVKKHINLEKPHLWVVYPRTREKGYDLHAQIVGIWEPENLSKVVLDASDEESDEPEDEPDTDDDSAAASETEIAAPEEPAPKPSGLVAIPPKPPAAPVAAAPPPEEVRDPVDGYFSIRGEVLFYSEENKNLIVRIQQTSKKKDKPPKAFKLHLNGELEGKTVGYFWDFQVQREGNLLVVKESKMIGLVPPRKRKGRPEGPGNKKRPPSRKPRKPFRSGEGGPPQQAAPREGSHREAPREAPSRPIKRSNRPPREPQGEQS